MKHLIYLICVWVIACSCGERKKVVESKEKSVPEEFLPITTDWNFEPVADVPEGFTFDTINYKDSIHRVHIYAYYFMDTSQGLQDYNRDVYRAMLNEIAGNMAGYGPLASEGENRDDWSEEYGPVKFSVTKDYISTQFINDSYTGGAHHNYSWFSINYNRKLKRVVSWNDIFRLRNEADSAALCSMIKRNLDHGDPTMELMDFFIDGDTVEFGPALSWASGMETARLPVDSLQRFMK